MKNDPTARQKQVMRLMRLAASPARPWAARRNAPFVAFLAGGVYPHTTLVPMPGNQIARGDPAP